MKPLTEFTKDERSLLLYFESMAVDYGGKVNVARMNTDDMAIAKEWDRLGFVEFGRIRASDISNDNTHYAFPSDEAFTLAHEERKARYERMKGKRTWMTTKEKQTSE